MYFFFVLNLLENNIEISIDLFVLFYYLNKHWFSEIILLVYANLCFNDIILLFCCHPKMISIKKCFLF